MAPNTATTDARPGPIPQGAKWKIWLERLGPLLALVIVTLGFAVADQIWGRGKFIEIRNLRVVLASTAPVAVAALGMTLIIITGGIDLSAGTSSVLCATVLALALNNDVSVGLAIALAIGTGACCGAFNGLLIGTLRIAPFIVTLGSMTIFLGIGKHLANSTTIFVAPERVPEWLSKFVSTAPPHWYGWMPNIPPGVWVALLIAVGVAIILWLTVFGRHLKAVGSNEATARL